MRHVLKKNRYILYLLSLVLLVACPQSELAQQVAALPMISFAEVPLYPPVARVANVSGVVHVAITTDGHRVVVAHAQDGPKVLGEAAEKNVKSWQFADHEVTTFTVTYVYKLVDRLNPQKNNPRIILQLPTDVEIDALRWPGTKDIMANRDRLGLAVFDCIALCGFIYSNPDRIAIGLWNRHIRAGQLAMSLLRWGKMPWRACAIFSSARYHAPSD